MRESYHEELDDISDRLVEMANTVGSQMSTATTALLDADVALADLVIAGDEQIDPTRESSRSAASRCWPASSRSPPTCGRSSSPPGSPATSSAWATSPRTSPRSPGCASRTTRSRRRSARRSSRPGTWPRCWSPRPARSSRRTTSRRRCELETDDDAMDRPAPRAVPPAARRGLVVRHRAGHRHHAARPLLRAIRRPRRLRRAPGRLPGHRRAARPGLRSTSHFLPWFLTASIAAAAAAGSRYVPPGLIGPRSGSRS